MKSKIKAEELRLGNYVDVPRKDQSPFRIDAFESLSNKFIKVAMIHPEHGENFHPLTWYGNELAPIPLTEEWLLKFGAKKFNDTFLIDRFRLIPRPQYGFYQVVDKETNAYFSKVEFVHEWQNLYFAMNGKELTKTEKA